MSLNGQYITIQGWMVSDLELSGSNLLTFALIYGFCQDGESEFKGSINYVCKWLNCSRPTAMKALKELVDLGLINKRIETVNGVTFNRYSINLRGVKKLYSGGKETLRGGGKETLHNNTNLDNTNYKIDIYDNPLGYVETKEESKYNQNKTEDNPKNPMGYDSEKETLIENLRESEFFKKITNYFSQNTEQLEMKVFSFLVARINNDEYQEFQNQTLAYIEYKSLSKEIVHRWSGYSAEWKNENWIDKLSKIKEIPKKTLIKRALI